MVLANDRMTPTDRLQVYNGAYLSRLTEVLESDYPALQYLLGHDQWLGLCAAYTDRHPSQHPNLNHFGRHMPEFARRRRSLPHRAFAAELATLEHGIAQAFGAEPFEPLDPARLQTIAADDWPRARLTTNPSLRMFAFRHPVNAYYIACREDQQPDPPAPTRSHVAVFRHDYRVWRLDLQPRAFAVLSALDSGETLQQALERARGHAQVGEWFQTWASSGLFTSIAIKRR